MIVLRPFPLVLTALALWILPVYSASQVGLISINGAIGPITPGYISRSIDFCQKQGYSCLVIRLDTPGGLLNSTKEIVQSLLSSPVPTIVYVAPAGATASSAGCFITLAADIAAMAPGTSIGAAHPVGGGEGAQASDDIMKKKLENFAAAFIASIAAQRHRNVQWAITSVRQSAAITAEEALKLTVIEVIATDTRALLTKVDGRSINGKTLRTGRAEIREIPMLLRERIFQRLWGPEILYFLMLIAIYGIIGELSNPGAILPAVTGGIALILALFMASVIPVNVTGAALLVLAVILFLADIFAPTHGVLTAGAIIAFAFGSILLFDRTYSGFRLSLAIVVPATVITTLFFLFVFGAGLRAQSLSVKTGRESMLHGTARAVSRITADQGRVFVEGEYWNAVSDSPVEEGELVEIVAIDGLTLRVTPCKKEHT